MRKSIVIIINIVFGLFLFFFTLMVSAMAQYANGEEQEFEYYFVLALGFVFLPCVTTFYGYAYYLFPRYLQHSKWWQGGLVALAISTFGLVIGLFYLLYLSSVPCSWQDQCIQDGIFVIFGIATFVGFVSLVIKGFLTWLDELKLKSELRQKNHEMEMSLIKAQLDPHFLFNTINNIDVLILKNAERASNYLNKLSDIMRFMLYETKVDLIPLRQEVEYIEKYIELQKIRTNNEAYIDYTLSGALDDKSIAPMLFIPFIENAFKHTTNKKLNKAIRIQIDVGEQEVQLRCSNKFNPNRQPTNGSTGLGDDLIRKRLNLIYPDQHQLQIEQQEEEYSVHLTVAI